MKNTYWKKNISYITILLSLLFIVSFGCGTKADWWFGISPEGFRSITMITNFVVTLIISSKTPASSRYIQELVVNIRKP